MIEEKVHGMDEIRIENLKIYAYHGVYAEENERGQDFYINAVLYTETRRAGNEDALTLSTDYGEVCHFINDFLKIHTFQLVEAMAEKTAEQILLHFPFIRKLDLEVRKPQAPIGLPFESVSVKIHRGWHKVYVALGSNMGNREVYIEDAVQKIKKDEHNKNIKVSPLYETKPYGEVQKQADFLNGAAEFETLYSPEELLIFLHRLEQEAERVREIHWGPRTLDLDILLYDHLVMDSEELTIPHADMHNREFVLKPLCDLTRKYRHPLLGRTVEELFRALQ